MTGLVARLRGRLRRGPVDGEGLAVAVTDRAHRAEAARALDRVPAARRLVLTGGPEALHRRLLRAGTVSTLVVHRRLGDGAQVGLWARLFPHVADGGTYLIVPEALGPGQGDRLRDRFQQLARRRGTRRHRGHHGRRGLARSVERCELDTAGIRLTKRGNHLFKMREAEIGEVLATGSRGLRVEELVVEPAGEVPVPLVVRDYRGDLVVRRSMVALGERLMLPESFKWHLADPLTNHRVVDIDGRVAELRERDEPVLPVLAGSYFYFDYKNGGHYGHLMAEAIGRLWAWDAAKERYPDLKLLLGRHPRDHDRTSPRPDAAVLEAYGVDPGDIVWFDDAVAVRHLVGATPLIHNQEPYYVHPRLGDVWCRITAGLPADDGPTYDRIFVTRPDSGNRVCRNRPEVEELFRAAGFEVVEPGGWSLARQARVFAHASVIAGFAGTAMFNLLHASGSPTVIVLDQESYDSRNEQLFAQVLGSPCHVFTSPADRAQPDDRFSYGAFQSSWSFDLERYGEELRALLAGFPTDRSG